MAEADYADGNGVPFGVQRYNTSFENLIVAWSALPVGAHVIIDRPIRTENVYASIVGIIRGATTIVKECTDINDIRTVVGGKGDDARVIDSVDRVKYRWKTEASSPVYTTGRRKKAKNSIRYKAKQFANKLSRRFERYERVEKVLFIIYTSYTSLYFCRLSLIIV